MSIETNKALVQAWEAHINAHELDAALSLLSPDFVDHTPPAGLPPGVEGVRMFFTMQFVAFPDGRWSAQDIIAEGDKVVRRVAGEGTHRGAFLGMAPTGKRVKSSFVEIWRIADGKLAEIWVESNMLDLMQQLGLVPPPRPAG